MNKTMFWLRVMKPKLYFSRIFMMLPQVWQYKMLFIIVSFWTQNININYRYDFVPKKWPTLTKFVTPTNNVNWTVVWYHVLSNKNVKVDNIIETNTNFTNKWWFDCCQWGHVFRDFFFYHHRLILFCYVHIFYFIFFFFCNWGKCHSVCFLFFDAEIKKKSFVRAAYLVLSNNSILVEWMKAENNILQTTGLAVCLLSGSPQTADKKIFLSLTSGKDKSETPLV